MLYNRSILKLVLGKAIPYKAIAGIIILEITQENNTPGSKPEVFPFQKKHFFPQLSSNANSKILKTRKKFLKPK